MTATPVILADHVRCRWCSQWRPPAEMIGGAVVGQCRSCYDWHTKALMQVVTAGVPEGCHECRVSVEALQAASVNGDYRLRLHRKDGVYQWLCLPCSDGYERKRRDQFGHTPYGHQRKL